MNVIHVIEREHIIKNLETFYDENKNDVNQVLSFRLAEGIAEFTAIITKKDPFEKKSSTILELSVLKGTILDYDTLKKLELSLPMHITVKKILSNIWVKNN